MTTPAIRTIYAVVFEWMDPSSDPIILKGHLLNQDACYHRDRLMSEERTEEDHELLLKHHILPDLSDAHHLAIGSWPFKDATLDTTMPMYLVYYAFQDPDRRYHGETFCTQQIPSLEALLNGYSPDFFTLRIREIPMR